MSNKILVIGATGNMGKNLVAGLVAKGEIVKAASRSGTAVPGAESVTFDFADVKTIGPAFEGVNRVYILVPTGYLNSEELVAPTLKTAFDRKVKIVLQTAMGVDADDSIPYRKIELQVERSGVPFVILRPNWFSDNFHTFWLAGIKQGVIAVPAADGKSSFIDVRDIAASAVAALTTNKFDGRAFNLTGPEALSYHDAAGILSKTLGRSIVYQPIDDEAFVKMLSGAGVPEAYARFLAMIFQPVREGQRAVVTDSVKTLTGKSPHSLESYAKDNAALFK